MPGKALRTALVRSVVRACPGSLRGGVSLRERRRNAAKCDNGHSGRVGMARRMSRAGMVADYTRAENAERAAKWLG